MQDTCASNDRAMCRVCDRLYGKADYDLWQFAERRLWCALGSVVITGDETELVAEVRQLLRLRGAGHDFNALDMHMLIGLEQARETYLAYKNGTSDETESMVAITLEGNLQRVAAELRCDTGADREL